MCKWHFEFIIGAYRDMKYTKPVLNMDNEKGSRFLILIFKKIGKMFSLKIL